MLTIGIPVHNDLEPFKAMIESLTNSTKAYDKIVIVLGDGITDGSDELIKNLAKLMDKIDIIQADTKTPLEAYNILFDLAIKENSDLFLTQTDVLFPKLYKRDWLAQMQQLAQRDEVGAVTCINGGGVSGPDYINGFHWLGGWCSYYPLKTLKKIGGYDKTFPNGYGVDIEHTYRIKLAGLQLAFVNYWVDHHQMNGRIHDRSPDAEKAMKESAMFFRRKYNL